MASSTAPTMMMTMAADSWLLKKVHMAATSTAIITNIYIKSRVSLAPAFRAKAKATPGNNVVKNKINTAIKAGAIRR